MTKCFFYEYRVHVLFYCLYMHIPMSDLIKSNHLFIQFDYHLMTLISF